MPVVLFSAEQTAKTLNASLTTLRKNYITFHWKMQIYTCIFSVDSALFYGKMKAAHSDLLRCGFVSHTLL